MDTPIFDFVRGYADKAPLRLHMPGHKGKTVSGRDIPTRLDITEIDGADVLYHSEGIIRKSEDNAAALFGTARTVYSTEGSSLVIRAMLYLAALYAGEYANRQGSKPTILAARNVHKTFVSAAALIDFGIEWIYSDTRQDLISCPISPENVENAICRCEAKPTAVYLTSPDYLGNTADIAGIAEVCHRKDVLLIVDNAHGAYRSFLPVSKHPIALGADLCCDSAHKTLPVLTGGAYLHLSKSAPRVMADWMEDAMALFASTSPSYLIMESLDLANRYLSDGYREKLRDCIDKIRSLKDRLMAVGYTFTGDEELKLAVKAKEYGYYGSELAELLRGKDIECEFYDKDYLVMMFTPENTEEEFETLFAALSAIPKKKRIEEAPPILTEPPQRALSVREAIFSPRIILPTAQCVGRILASAALSCPPAVPILISGERITKSAADCMKYYGIEECGVVK